MRERRVARRRRARARREYNPKPRPKHNPISTDVTARGVASIGVARPLYHGVRRSVWDPETSRERVGDWGGPATIWTLLCVAERRATRPNGDWRYSTRRHVLGPSAQRRCHPKEALYLPTFSHLLIVNKLLSLCLYLALFLPPSPSPSLSLFSTSLYITVDVVRRSQLAASRSWSQYRAVPSSSVQSSH